MISRESQSRACVTEPPGDGRNDTWPGGTCHAQAAASETLPGSNDGEGQGQGQGRRGLGLGLGEGQGQGEGTGKAQAQPHQQQERRRAWGSEGKTGQVVRGLRVSGGSASTERGRGGRQLLSALRPSYLDRAR